MGLLSLKTGVRTIEAFNTDEFSCCYLIEFRTIFCVYLFTDAHTYNVALILILEIYVDQLPE